MKETETQQTGGRNYSSSIRGGNRNTIEWRTELFEQLRGKQKHNRLADGTIRAASGEETETQ